MIRRPLALVIVGTQPEAIKLAPVVKRLRSSPVGPAVKLCASGQHSFARRQLIELGLSVDIECQPVPHPVRLADLLSLLVERLSDVVELLGPRIVIVQGDTATALAGALAAARCGATVAHIEAGLRTGNLAAPFPEETYRRILATLAELHFAPTPLAAENLRREGVLPAFIFVTGNTIVDAFKEHTMYSRRPADSTHPSVLVSLHRREILGKRLQSMFYAVCVLADKYRGIEFVCLLNDNPAVARAFCAARARCPRSNLTARGSMPYGEFLDLLAVSHFVMTDSGGIQEEAPLLGKPALVLREQTDRPESISSGGAKLVGTSSQSIVAAASELIEARDVYGRMARVHSPFGDGHASKRICDTIVQRLLRPTFG